MFQFNPPLLLMMLYIIPFDHTAHPDQLGQIITVSVSVTNIIGLTEYHSYWQLVVWIQSVCCGHC